MSEIEAKPNPQTDPKNEVELNGKSDVKPEAKPEMSPDPLEVAINKIAAAEKADILVYCGQISHQGFQELRTQMKSRRMAENLVLLLGTAGGDPDAAYRIMRCLHHRYKKIAAMIPYYCKSAGTLMVIGADTLVMPDNSELGPIDMQVAKHDELFDQSSSLTPKQALDVLSSSTFQVFEKYFFTLRKDTQYQLTSKTCADIAARLSIGLFEPIYGQIDPMRIAEMHRALTVARKYGQNLDRGNLKTNALDYLISGYPSHEFVIDRKEAEGLFKTVRKPNADEQQLLEQIEEILGSKMSHASPAIHFLTNTEEEHTDGESLDAQSRDTKPSADPTGSAEGAGSSDRPSTGDRERTVSVNSASAQGAVRRKITSDLGR